MLPYNFHGRARIVKGRRGDRCLRPGPFTLLPSALCRLHSQADIATITLDQDDVRLGFACGSLRLFSESTLFVFRLSSTLDYMLAASCINPFFDGRLSLFINQDI